MVDQMLIDHSVGHGPGTHSSTLNVGGSSARKNANVTPAVSAGYSAATNLTAAGKTVTANGYP